LRCLQPHRFTDWIWY